MKSKKTLAIFDFDGTLTVKDTLLDFIVFSKGYGAFLMGFFWLSRYIFLHLIGLYPNWKLKQKVLKLFFGGMDYKTFKKLGSDYASIRLHDVLRDKAITKLNYHLKEGHKVLVVTASPKYWIEGWTSHVGIELISTRLEVVDEQVTGRIDGRNCYGAEKLKRIDEYLDREFYDEIYAYGDSRGDRQILAIATKPFYKSF